MIHLIDSILCGATFLLTFLIFINFNKVNIKANEWFGAFVFCIFLILLQNIVLFTKLCKEDDFVFELISLSSFIISPIFYLSVSYYVEPFKKWRKRDFLHFVFVILMLFLVTLAHLINVEVKQEEIDSKILENASIVFYIIFGLQVIPYCILAFIKIIKHQKNIQFLNSTVENIDLKWLKNIIVGVLIIALFWVIDIIFNLSNKSKVFDYLSSLTYFFGILYITYYWLKQKEIFPYNLIEKEEIKTIILETTIIDENKKQLLTDEKLEQLKKDLLELINSKKPFLESDLSLLKLATQLNISSHLLSYVINSGFDENFYQFINRYRIEEAKKLIIDTKMNYLSLLGIGFEVGFNSKTVFNTTFKKITGQTPSEFKKKNSQKISSDL